MILVQQKKLALNETLGDILPEFSGTEKEKIQIIHLLCHNSGLPDYRPYHEELKKIPFNERNRVLGEFLVKEPLVYPTGKKVLYSDLGFMILCRIVETVSGKRLDHYVYQEIFNPIGIKDIFYKSNDPACMSPMMIEEKYEFAATAKCPWRNKLLVGEVHDDNAYTVGGIAGHAGLFGTAGGVYAILAELLAVYHGNSVGRVFQIEIVQQFLKEQFNSGRTIGFDKPSLSDSSSGKYFSKNTVGHLGYTGTSFWMDLDQKIIVVLLTNRVHPSAENEKIRVFRPQIHDAVMMGLKKTVAGNHSLI